MLLFRPSTREAESFDTLAGDIRADDLAVEERNETVSQIGDLLRRIIWQNDDRQTVYFELGAWIQSLRTAAVAARECKISLAEVVAVADYRDTGRQFSRYLREVGADDATVASVDRLVSGLEEPPADDEGIAALLAQLARVGKSVAPRD